MSASTAHALAPLELGECHRLLGEIALSARQVSLLAVNAALEAASVGQRAHGAGVVACAVRGLSDRAAVFGERLQDSLPWAPPYQGTEGSNAALALVRSLARDVAQVVDDASYLAVDLLQDLHEPEPVLAAESACQRVMDSIAQRAQALEGLFAQLPPSLAGSAPRAAPQPC